MRPRRALADYEYLYCKKYVQYRTHMYYTVLLHIIVKYVGVRTVLILINGKRSEFEFYSAQAPEN